ncbi:hypothetical protein [Helicobacter sp.]|uniref:hypothetical protein n=1 Tax=Helicobacter sp. TaxID=218 RepID=UPI0025C7317A|nr:hypothetical protein [Helicobacter sp.]MBR2494264.1 hypothetical protein [Helicobacter sp.]
MYYTIFGATIAPPQILESRADSLKFWHFQKWILGFLRKTPQFRHCESLQQRQRGNPQKIHTSGLKKSKRSKSGF